MVDPSARSAVTADDPKLVRKCGVTCHACAVGMGSVAFDLLGQVEDEIRGSWEAGPLAGWQ